MLEGNGKRILSFLLALVLVLSLLPTNAFVPHVHAEEEHVHNYVAGEPMDATCLFAGETVYKCTCGDSYSTYTAAKSGHTWTFADNSATSNNGSKLTVYKPATGEVSVVDGALSLESRATLTLSSKPTLKADADWTMEIVAKADTDADGNPLAIGGIATTGSYSVGNKATVFVYIDNTGDLSIGKHYTVVDENGVASERLFGYYKVSDEAFAKSTLASESFDVTDYHKYQLRHSATGVYSFWVDNQEIGKLTMTADSATRADTKVTSTAARDDLNADFKVSYVGCGDSPSSYTNLGLRGTVKLLGFYPGHDVNDDGDCTTDDKCTVCDTVVTAAKGSHDYVADPPIEATCFSRGEATHSCSICDSFYGTFTPAKSGSTWDFAKNSINTTGGKDNSLVYVVDDQDTYVSAGIPVANGTLTTTARLTMELANSITLEADKEWIVEIEAKPATVDGSVKEIGAILSTGKDVKTSTFINIDQKGELTIGKRITYTGVTAKGEEKTQTTYTYYKVSAEDYNNSVLATSDFDATQYHNYQLHHSADGTFTFILDGKEIGKLALTDNGKNRAKASTYYAYTGEREDLNEDLVMTTIGGGLASSDYTNFGLLGSVKYFGVYTGHEAAEDDGDCTTAIKCKNCEEVLEEGTEGHVPVSADDDDCTTAVKCANCETAAIPAKTHKWSDNYSYSAEGHYKTCENDGCNKTTTVEAHKSSGPATIEKAETCTVCGYEIAPMLDHTHGVDVTKHTGKAATCTATGTKTYYECSCGKFYEDSACTTQISDLDAWKVIEIDPDAHSFGKWNNEIPATCTESGTKGYKTCSACKKNFDAEGNELTDLTIPALEHDYASEILKANDCITYGETKYTCKRTGCGHSYTGYVPALNGITWDFTTGDVKAVDDNRTLEFNPYSTGNTYTSMDALFTNGALTADSRVVLKLSSGIKLANDGNWAVEIVAKGDGTNYIGSFAVAGSYSITNAISVYINQHGDLSIFSKASYTADNGSEQTNKNAYYKVSNQDFNNSVLATDAFDVTQYHTYQLRHSADGTFTFYLDGVKVGNLNLTEATNERGTSHAEYTGPRADLDKDLTVSYIGGGVKDGGYINYGIKGAVKLIGFYYQGHTAIEADDGDCTTEVKCTACGGIAIEGAKAHTPAKDDGDCTTAVACAVCGKEAIAAAKNHTPEADDGDCLTAIKCSVCGTVTTEAKTEHVPAADDGDCTTDILCKYCDQVAAEGADSHTPAADDGDCTTAIKCSICGTVTTKAKTHKWSTTYGSTAEGHYKTCTNAGCNQRGAQETHKSSGAATENKAETCTVCGYVITPALAHTHGTTVTQRTGKAATCVAEGVKTYYECSCGNAFEDKACTKVITDLAAWKVIPVDPAGHKFGQLVAEVPASCEEDGTKAYKPCTLCKKNYDKNGNLIEDLTIKSDGHDYKPVTTKEGTCLAHGEVYYQCAVCNHGTLKYTPGKSGYSWDFADDQLTADNGSNELSFHLTANSGVHNSIPLANGEIVTQTRVTMKLAEPIILQPDRDWVIEFIAKGNGTDDIGAVLSTSDDVGAATYVHINKYGELSIGRKDGSLNNGGGSKWFYYKVSNEVYSESILAKSGFDVTKYHTYQLRYTDGVYSFWLDGQIIGDLCMTENGTNHSNKTYVEYSGMTDGLKKVLDKGLVMSYVGAGLVSSGVNSSNFGLLGGLKFMGVYTGHTANADDSDCTTNVLCGTCGAVLVKGAASHTPEADDGNCTTDILCSICHKVATKGKSKHSFTKNLVSEEMATPATCTEAATYYIHCDNCAVVSKDKTLVVGKANGHKWDEGKVTKEPTPKAPGIMTFTCTVAGCGATYEEEISNTIKMTYDDRVGVTTLGQAGEPVISDQVVTSYKVGTKTLDDNVLIYESGKLIAVGTGTAKVTWGTGSKAVTYEVVVEPAPISILMITGHSLGAGSRGVPEESVICEVGQVYSTNEVPNDFKLCVGDANNKVTGSVDITGMGLGYGSEIRPENIDALTSMGEGMPGADSTLAYQWTKLTGEKVWILNSSIGSSNLSSWQKGGVNYIHAVQLFKTAEQILNNETIAGHYRVNHMGMINYSTANGDQSWIVDRYTKSFNSMWDGFRKELALFDFNGDGTKDTVDCMGILPTWKVAATNDWSNPVAEPLAFNNGKIINYVMGAFSTNGVIIASDVGRKWTTDRDVRAYFAENPIKNMYGMLQSGDYHQNPTTVRGGVNYDGIHYTQLGYNIQGIEAANSLYNYWYGVQKNTTVRLLQIDGVKEVPATVTITEGKNYVIVPDVQPLGNKITVEITGDDVITYEGGYVTATGVGTAKLIFKDLDGKELKTVTIVTEKRSEEFYDDVVWYAWDFEKDVVSTDGNNSLIHKYGSMSQGDGKVDFDSAVVELEKGILLDKTNDWAIEFTLKAKVDSKGAIVDPGTLAANGSQVSSAISICLNNKGSLFIMKRGDIGSYTAKYWNFAVDSATLKANLPEGFDMTQYHTYQLRCTDGVFSYWLDGKKIGDLTTTSWSNVSYTGEQFNFNTITIKYLGNGNTTTNNKNGICAVVDEMKLFADGTTLSFDVGLDAAKPIDTMQVYPGNAVVLTRPDTGDYCAKFVGWNTAADMSGKTYKVGEKFTVTDLVPVTLYAQWGTTHSGTGVHVWGKYPQADAVKIPADCKNPAVYYTSCSECGATSAGTATEETFTSGGVGDHNYVIEKIDDKYLKEKANCEHPDIYYKSCATCGISSKGSKNEVTFTNGTNKHNYTSKVTLDGTCTSHGEKKNTCKDCGHSYISYVSALSGYTWDFTQHSVKSIDGGNALQFYKSANTEIHSDIPFADGALNTETRVTMGLTNGVTMKANEDWIIEVVAKGDGANAIGAIASTRASVSYSTFVYIDSTGDLSIGKKASYTGDNGQYMDSKFIYYKVSNEVYNASVLASDTFDIKQYHTYQLRHTNGVYSFWLDGEKIGDLTLTENGISRTNSSYVEYNGVREDLNVDLTISYFGCGDGGSNYTNMGLLGSVKLYGLYSGHSYSLVCDPDCDNTGCDHVREVEHTLVDDGDCTTAVLCSVCSKELVAAKPSHTWSKDYGYTMTGHYHKCTVCGTRDKQAAHVSSGKATNNKAETCTVCGYVITAALNHTHGNPKTHTGKAATCVASGLKTYYECSCTKLFENKKCTTEIADLETWIVIPIDENGHSFTKKASDILKSEATCTEPAQYLVACDLCGKVHESQTVSVGQALGHDFTAEVVDDQFLKNVPDCDTVAVYYKCCAVCGISSKGSKNEATFETKERHNYTSKVKTYSTCTSHGEAEYTCVDCGHKYLANIPALSGYTWDFSTSNDTSTNGKNTLTIFKSFNDTYQQLPVKNGVLEADERLTIKLSQPVTLKRSDNWVIEIVAKTNGKEGIRAFFATNFAVSSATYIYIDEAGDLSIGKKLSYTADDGTTIANKFSYYKVSNEDFETSILSSKDFDPTEYHTYQLRCTNGVFSYWLDGEKIGDLSMTENIPNRSDDYAEYTGPRDDLDTLKITYIGCGDGTNRAGLGLRGSVKYMGIYGGHSFSNVCDTHCNNEGCSYMREVPHDYEDDGDCTTAVACTLCGEIVIAAKPDHTWSEKYSYSLSEHYRVCTVCDTEEARQSHTSSGSATNDKAETCTVCGYVINAALGHVHGTGVQAHAGIEATCQTPGTKTYYECSCGKFFEDAGCTVEIDDLRHWSVTELGKHRFTAEVATNDYLKAKANYDRAAIYYKSCSVCGLSSAGQPGQAEFSYGYPGDGYFSVVSKNEWDTAPGIKETKMVLNNDDGDRRQIVYFMEVDINNEYASILPSYRNMNPTPGNYGTQIMSEQAKYVEENWGLNVVGGMNTFLTSGAQSDYYKEHPELRYEPLGIFVINGEVYANTSRGAETCLVVNYDEKDGVKRPASIPKVELRDTADGLTGWEEQAVPALWGWLVKDGVNLTNAQDHEDNIPRSVLGVKADGTIVMLVNDGRQQPYSYGMTYYELAEMMISLGCVDAINCDGGGSSVFVSQRPGEELKVNSSPSNGGERATITGILAISTAPATGEFVRASVTTDYVYYTPGSTIQFNAVGTDLAGNAAEIPESVTWKITEGMGTIDKNGKFVSNGNLGEVTAQMVQGDKVVGSAKINIVNPEKLQFAQSVITIPNGRSAKLNIIATYGPYDVKIKAEDFKFELSDPSIGKMDGLTLSATDDLSITSGSVTMTYLHNNQFKSTAQLVFGQASTVLYDFEDGAQGWYGHKGPYKNYAKWVVSGVDSNSGLVHNGNGSLAVTADFTYSIAKTDNFFNLTHGGETIVIKNAQSIGFWIYVPEEVAFASLMVYFNANDDKSQTKTEVLFNDENTLKPGWRYVSVDISMHDSITIKKNTLFLRIYSAMSAKASALAEVPGLNYKATWYIDDITVDYSVAVDDREEPIFEKIMYVDASNGGTTELDGLTITEESPTFEVNAAENLTKNNATGLDDTTVKAYIDGNLVNTSYLNGKIIVNSNVKLADGKHKLDVMISDMLGNTAKASATFTMVTYEDVPTIRVVPRDETLTRLLIGSQYWIDVVASDLEKTQSATVKLNLNNHSIWQLDHMEVAEGFTATWSMDTTNPTENIAIIHIERTGDSKAVGENVLVSIPIRVWEWRADEQPSYATPDTMYTPAERWDMGLIFKTVLSVKLLQGTLKLTDSSVVACNNDDIVVDTELNVNAYNRADEKFFVSNKNSWHIHEAGKPESKEATCTEYGYTDRVFCVGCACGSTEVHDATGGCGAILEWGTTIPATGHTYKIVDDQIVCDCGDAMGGSGILEFNGAKYYLIAGKLATGWQSIGYDLYYADHTTKQLATGERTMYGQTFTFDENGKLLTKLEGLVNMDGTIFYFKDGQMYYAGLIEIDGYYYYINSKCQAVTGRYHIGKTNGLMPAGTYNFDKDGKMLDPRPMEPDKVEVIAMHRLYNPNSGEHFYTGSVEERDMLVTAGWQYEGVAWNAPVSEGAPIYRLYNPNSGDHHYTGSIDERDYLVSLGWQYEGVAWNTFGVTDCPQFRLYNPNADVGSHHYTGSAEERDFLVSLGWIYEGIAWYGSMN